MNHEIMMVVMRMIMNWISGFCEAVCDDDDKNVDDEDEDNVDENDGDDDDHVNNDPPQYSISQRLFGEAVLGLSQVQPVTHQAFSYHISFH